MKLDFLYIAIDKERNSSRSCPTDFVSDKPVMVPIQYIAIHCTALQHFTLRNNTLHT